MIGIYSKTKKVRGVTLKYEPRAYEIKLPSGLTIRSGQTVIAGPDFPYPDVQPGRKGIVTGFEIDSSNKVEAYVVFEQPVRYALIPISYLKLEEQSVRNLLDS